MYYTSFNNSYCEIFIIGNESGLKKIFLSFNNNKPVMNIDWEKNDLFFIDTVKQLHEYFAGKRKKFSLKISPEGTSFQKKVWNSLLKIPYGETKSYKQIAIEIGSENAARAVGRANNKNPLPIIIPCHRVIGNNGSLTGFAYGLNIKQKLLDMESKNFKLL